MQEKKSEVASKNPKKVNLLDHHSIKHILDETVSEIVASRGYKEDVRMSNARLLIGTVIIIIALVAQFYKKKFPENRDFLIGCIVLNIIACIFLYFHLHKFLLNSRSKTFSLYGILEVGNSLQHALLMIRQLTLIGYTKEKNAILFTYPPSGSFTSTGLVVSSKLPRFSDLYTLTISSADPKSISANKPVHFTESVTQWFTKDGNMVEGLFWREVDALIDEYAKEPKKNK